MNKRLTNEKTGPEVARTKSIKTAVEIALVVLAFISVTMLFTGCTPKRQDVPVFWGNTPRQAVIAAGLHAQDVGGVFYQVAPTGSMRPFLGAGDYVVVQPIPYDKVEVGQMANYQASWLPDNSPTVIHWVAAKQGDYWIMDGQANKHYEGNGMLMGKKEFRGIVVGVYTTRPAP